MTIEEVKTLKPGQLLIVKSWGKEPLPFTKLIWNEDKTQCYVQTLHPQYGHMNDKPENVKMA